MSGDVKKRGIPDLDFLNKQLGLALFSVKNYDNLANNKLLLKGDDSCVVLSFEDIGT